MPTMSSMYQKVKSQILRTDGPSVRGRRLDARSWQKHFEKPDGKQFSRMFNLTKKIQKGTVTTLWTAEPNVEEAPSHGSGRHQTYAVKRVKKRPSGRNEALLEQVRILRAIQHPHVVKIYQFYQDDRDFDYVVLENLAGGELFDHIAAKEGYNEQEARAICRALLTAIEHCHEQDVIHRDLKPSSMALSSDNATIKLSGFGLACSVADGPRSEQCGTPHYVAPEVLQGDSYGKPVDMWSMGVIMYTILSGSLPFKAMRQATLFRKIKEGSYNFRSNSWNNVSSTAKDMISKLLIVDSTQRLTARQALLHPWFEAADRSLAGHDLRDNLEELQVFNAKRKMRAAIQSVLAAKVLMSSLKGCERDYVLGRKLGQGAFATVFSATKRGAPPGSEEFAVKRTTRRGLQEQDIADLLREVAILREMDHPNVVGFVEFYDDDPDYYYMVLEFMAGGELFTRIVEKEYYNEEEARDLCRVLLGSMKYIHDRGVVHRDLKPENLLLAKPQDDTSVKLADFGFACSVQNGPLTTQCGTPGYVAPEILNAKEYGTSVDMWSIGVIIYILLGGYPPFMDENQTRLFRKIKAGNFKFHEEYWRHVSADAQDLIKKLLVVDEKRRYTATQAVNHPWLTVKGDSLKGRDLGKNLDELRIFNAKRKLRAAVKTVVAARKFVSPLDSLFEESGL